MTDQEQEDLWAFAEKKANAPNKSRATDISAEQKLEQEKSALIHSVAAQKADTLRERVAWLLNAYPDTRDSDVALQLKYWEVFEADVYDGHSIAPSDLYRLTRLTTLTRARARIQNQYRLFLASRDIRKRRGTLSDEEKEKAVEEAATYPVFIVYMDESGKTSDHLVVGSLWFIGVGHEAISLHNQIEEIRTRAKFTAEFHFKTMREQDLSLYCHLIDLFAEKASTVSFKLITLPKHGLRNVQDALSEMYYHLLTKGIEHEDATGRAPLPRTLQVWKDLEEPGADKLLLATLQDRLRHAGKTLYDDRLRLDEFFAVDSENNFFVQIADLFASSANRLLNRSGVKHTHKDVFAEYLFNKLGCDPGLAPNDKMGDRTVHMEI